ncbi:MAG: hypothetical protein AAFQ54_06245 [Pseudomonadota bacterium]
MNRAPTFQRYIARRGLLWLPSEKMDPLQQVQKQSLLDYGLALLISLGAEDVSVAVPEARHAAVTAAIRMGRDLGINVRLIGSEPGLPETLRAGRQELLGSPLMAAPLGLFLSAKNPLELALQDTRQRGATVFVAPATGGGRGIHVTADALGLVNDISPCADMGAMSRGAAALGLTFLDPRALDFASWLSVASTSEEGQAALLRLYASERGLRAGTLPAAAAWHQLGPDTGVTDAHRFVARQRKAGSGLFGLPEVAAFERGLIGVPELQDAAIHHAGSRLGEALERRLNEGVPDIFDPRIIPLRAISSG